MSGVNEKEKIRGGKKEKVEILGRGELHAPGRPKKRGRNHFAIVVD